MTAARTTYVVILGVILTAGGCGDFFKSGGGGGSQKSHALTAILIDSDCQYHKDALVQVTSNAQKQGKVDWYVVSECGNYNGFIVTIADFKDKNGNPVPPPTQSGDCPKCSGALNGAGFVKLHIDPKAVTSTETFDYRVWIGPPGNPKQKELTDPKLEIDP